MTPVGHSLKLLEKKAQYKFSFFNNYKTRAFELARDRDYYTVLEYPKCGRTWLRYMLCQAVSAYFKIPLENIIFDVVYEELKLPYVYYVHGFSPKIPLCDHNYRRLFNTYFCPKGTLFLVRKPERVMISYFNQLKYRTRWSTPIPFETASQMIRHPDYGIQKYTEYVDFYMNALEHKNHMTITYEELKIRTYATFSKILSFIELDLKNEIIEKILQNSTFEKMKEVERKKRYKIGWLLPVKNTEVNSFKIRSGGKEKIEDYFSKEDMDYMKNIYSPSQYMKQFGYCD